MEMEIIKNNESDVDESACADAEELALEELENDGAEYISFAKRT